mgnify:CR=1 FL=1
MDFIEIDAQKRTLNLAVSAKDIKKRLAKLKPFTPKVTGGWLGRYARHVLSAHTGAVMDNVLVNSSKRKKT